MYLSVKFVHILSVVAFLGNITTGLFWHAHAAMLAHTMEGIIRSDRLFITPSVILIAVSGVAAPMIGHLSILRTGWILWSLQLSSVTLAQMPKRRHCPWSSRWQRARSLSNTACFRQAHSELQTRESSKRSTIFS